MWIQGKPGSGKSVLASQIIQDLHSFAGSVVIYVFCKNGEETKNSLESVLRNMIFQALEWSPQKKAFHRLLLNARLNEKSQFAQSIEGLWNLLTQMINETEGIHCVIDGLDECHSSKSERVTFLSRLVEIFRQRTPWAKLVLISQLNLSESGDHSSLWMDFSIQTSSVRDDIELLASTRIESSKVLNKHPEKENLLKQLVDRSDGMILWAELMINELEAGHWNIQNVLQKPPEGLFEMWQSILQRMSYSRLGAKKLSHTLQLVLAAARPLRYEELALGLAVAQGLCQHEDYDVRGDARAEGRLAVLESSPLLTSMPDDTVQLTHSSLKDYLFCQDAPSVSTFLDFNEQDIHARMTAVLITYMSFQSFSSALTEIFEPKYFLLEYATRALLYHSIRAGASTQTADEIVTFFDTVQSWKWLQRISEACGMSFGHQQLLQSDLASWAQSSCFGDKIVYIFSNFLLILAQNRHETMKSLPNDDPLLLDSMDNLALTYREFGQFSKAEELAVQVLAISNEQLGAEYPVTLNRMHTLAMIYRDQGRWSEAEEKQVKVLEFDKRMLGAEHPNTLISINQLALTLSHQQRFSEAEEMQVQVVETQKRVLGAEHLDTLGSMHNLAMIYNDQGRWSEAEEMLGQVVEIEKRVLGAEHPNTLISINQLASTLSNQERISEAEDMVEQVLEIQKRILGAEHPNTLGSMHSLGVIYNYQGRWLEAEEMLEQVVETRKRVLGAKHLDTLRSMKTLAHTFFHQGRYTESEQFSLQVLETFTRVLGVENPKTLTSMHNLAYIYMNQNRQNEAIELMKKVVDLSIKIKGADHPHTLKSLSNLNKWSCTG